MSLNMPITRRKIRNHFHYNFWKYLLLIALAMFGWNLVYTTSRYRSPENLKVEFYAEGPLASSDTAQALADRIHAQAMPEMEEVTATVVRFDDAYGDMQLVVWISSGQGDVYLLSKARFESMAQNGTMLDLAPYVESGVLHPDGIDLSGGSVRASDTGRTELYGIPADSLTGLAEYGLSGEGQVLCVLLNNGNDPYALKFLDYLLTNLR